MLRFTQIVTCLAALTVGRIGAVHLVEFNDEFLNKLQAQEHHNQSHPHHPHQLLAQPEIGYPECDVAQGDQDTNDQDKVVHVLLTFSTCIPQDQLNTINTWVESIKSAETNYFQNGHSMKIVFDSTMIPGACQDETERMKKGLPDTTTTTGNTVVKNTGEDESEDESEDTDMVQRKLEAELIHTRLAAFEAHGTVLESLPTKESLVPLAMISFVNDAQSYQEIAAYEREYQIGYSKTFQFCHDIRNCEGFSKNCIQLAQEYDLFMYNPFQISRRVHCQASLPGGIPVSYAVGNDRKCYCTCPLKTTGVKGPDGKFKCVATTDKNPPPEVYPWDGSPYEYDVKDRPTKCRLTNLYSSYVIDGPFPFDNYVADKRINADDLAMVNADSPRLELSYKLSKDGAKATTNTYTWLDYQQNYQKYLDAMEFTQFGRYDLELDAFNYIGQAKSTACLAITDSSRPIATRTCPKIFCDTTGSLCEGYDLGNAEYTPANVAKFLDVIKQFYEFQNLGVSNDGCSINNRCDVETLVVDDFYKQVKNVPYKNAADAINSFVTDFFDPKSTTFVNPIKDVNTQPNVLDYPKTCTRCLSMYVALQEKYTTFNCGGDKEVERCAGQPGQSCKLDQCLAVYGDTFASVDVQIDPAVAANSQQVIDQVVQKGYNTITQVHVALECEDLGATNQGVCDFTTTMNQLLIRTVAARNGVPANVDPKTFVFWRYKLDKGSFYDFNANTKHTFTAPQTTITVEAWTQCGKVRDMFFYVFLHTASKIIVCDKFDSMWYQTTVSHATLNDKVELCNYPHTDFVELTFDYHPNVGINYDINQLNLVNTGVECTFELSSPTASAATPKRTPAVVLSNKNKSPEIVERFAVELLNTPGTDRKTKIDILCTFTYTNYNNQQVRTKTCPKTFVAKSCNNPILGLPGAEDLYKCAGTANKPGPFEACGGTVVKSTATSTVVTTTDQTCCDLAGKTTCSPLIGLPAGQKDIKYCAPMTAQGKPYFEQTVKLLGDNKHLANLSQQQVQLAGLSLVGALVGAAMMMVVRRRRATEQMPILDAYHPLLD